ncbi:phosphopantetheine-binding protein [Paenibacillus sp. KS-LC4]|uniref:phosphopantetheine-binding protein n=1 Tax=Paenibacillus sp. KS-LC4 TaxID=2979727 RepID=UPI0030D3511B
MYEQIITLIKPYTNLPELPQEELVHLNLNNYGLDSISSINLVLDIETHFNIVYPDELLMFEDMNTLQKLVDAVTSIVNEQTTEGIK